MVPDAGGDDATGPRDARHLAEPGDRIGNEVHDELGERRIEGVVVERQLLGRRRPHVDAGVARPGGRDEGLGRVHGRDVLRPEARRRARRSARPVRTRHRARAGRADPGEVGELRRQAARVPAHEPVVGVRRDIEAHPVTVPGPPAIRLVVARHETQPSRRCVAHAVGDQVGLHRIDGERLREQEALAEGAAEARSATPPGRAARCPRRRRRARASGRAPRSPGRWRGARRSATARR